MFNKPSLFPKTGADAAVSPPRGGRLVPGGASGGSEGGFSAREPLASGAVASTASPASSSGLAGVAAGSVAAVEKGVAPAGESQLIVGPNVKLKGAEILDCDTLVVEGRVEAKMDSRVIRVAENGAFSGTVCIDVAEIFGRFDGELTARTQLVIHATGKVSGTIRYGKILIEEGGEISGDIRSIDAAEPVVQKTDWAARATGSTGTTENGAKLEAAG